LKKKERKKERKRGGGHLADGEIEPHEEHADHEEGKEEGGQQKRLVEHEAGGELVGHLDIDLVLVHHVLAGHFQDRAPGGVQVGLNNINFDVDSHVGLRAEMDVTNN